MDLGKMIGFDGAGYDAFVAATLRALDEAAPGTGLGDAFLASHFLIDWPDVPSFETILAELRRTRAGRK